MITYILFIGAAISFLSVLVFGILRTILLQKLLVESKKGTKAERIMLILFPFIFIWPIDIPFNQRKYKQGRLYAVIITISTIVFYLLAYLFLNY